MSTTSSTEQGDEGEGSSVQNGISLVGMTLNIEEEQDTEEAEVATESNCEMTQKQLRDLLEEAEKQRELGRQQRQQDCRFLLGESTKAPSPPVAMANADVADATATSWDGIDSSHETDDAGDIEDDRCNGVKGNFGVPNITRLNPSPRQMHSIEAPIHNKKRKGKQAILSQHPVIAIGVSQSNNIPGAYAVDTVDTSTAVTFVTDESSMTMNSSIHVSSSRQNSHFSTDNLEARRLQPGLAVAQVVNPGAEILSTLPVAQEESQIEVRRPKRTESNTRSHRRCFLYVFLAFVASLLVAAMVSVVIRLHQDTRSSFEATRDTYIAKNNTDVIANKPTRNMTSRLLHLLPESAKRQIINGNTPHYKAFMWVLKDPTLSPIENQAASSTRLEDWRLQQRFAVALLYYSMGGANWYNNSNWLSYDVHECSWWFNPIFGTIDMATLDEDSPWKTEPCDSTSMKFQDIWLQNNRLTGTIPEELFVLLPSLRMAGLYSNEIQGTIPTEVGLASNLETLALSKNHLVGSIPTEIANLSHLILLGLVSNSLAGHLPAKWPKMLVVVQLEENGFSGTIPVHTGELHHLKDLSLCSNSLSGSIPSALGQARSLMRLHLANNHLMGSLPSELGQLKMLQSFLIQGNAQLRGTLPLEIGDLACGNCTLVPSGDWVNGFRPPRIEDERSNDITNRGSMRNGRLGSPDPTGEIGDVGGPSMIAFNLSDTLISGQVPTSLCSILDPTSFDCSDVLCGCNCSCYKPQM